MGRVPPADRGCATLHVQSIAAPNRLMLGRETSNTPYLTPGVDIHDSSPVEGTGSSGGEEAVSIPLLGPTEGSHIRGELRQNEGVSCPKGPRLVLRGSCWADQSRYTVLCRKKDDGKLMVQCNECKEWFHGKCVVKRWPNYFCPDLYWQGIRALLPIPAQARPFGPDASLPPPRPHRRPIPRPTWSRV